MRAPRLLPALVSGVAGLAILHACQEPDPTEPMRPTDPTLPGAVVLKTLLVKSTGGNGSGVVTSSPAGINCVITVGVAATTGCSAKFTQGTVVTLTAAPDPGHALRKWSGSCTGSGTCQVSMSVNRTVDARFLRGPFTLKIKSGTAGVGSGRVTSQDGLTPAIDCQIVNGTAAATGCSATYPAYTEVTLTATPAAGFVFSAWGVPCSGTGTCLYIANQGRTIAATFGPGGPGPSATEGQWETPFTGQIVGIHVSLLPTAKVLLWGKAGEAQLWDPANPGAGFQQVTAPNELFCSGHSFLSDGRLLVAGGHSVGTAGIANAVLFDPSAGSWSPTEPMIYARYYPTLTALPNGEMLSMTGQDETRTIVTTPEIWNGSTWRSLSTAVLSIPNPWYPPMFVAPNGQVFLAGFLQTSRYLDVSGTGTWTTVADRQVADRTMGSAVMYAPGKILYMGGGDPPTNSAEVIDLNQAAPSWRSVTGMAFARRQLNATILADGQVLVTHGTGGAGFNNLTTGVRAAELWNPATESWTTMASETSARMYHSTAVLLPDARVLTSGSGEGGGVTLENSNFSSQVFSPPYLFNSNGTLAARPAITSAPSTISYGQSLAVETPDVGSVTRGSLIRLSSVTHAFNMSQLIYPLTFSATGPTTVTADGPANANLAPPGPYLLFLVNGSGVPSEAKMVMVGPAGP